MVSVDFREETEEKCSHFQDDRQTWSIEVKRHGGGVSRSAGAAYEVRVECFPGQKQTFDDAFFQAVNRLRPTYSTGAGIDLGRKIADIETSSISPCHITFGADAAAVLSSFLGPRRLLSITSDGLPGFYPSFTPFHALANDAEVSRVDDGIPSSIDNTGGPILGHKIGRYVVHHAFRIHAPR